MLFDDDDDDLFAPRQATTRASAPSSSEKSVRHTFDGSVCPTCAMTHEVVTAGPIPDEVTEKLSDILDTLPDKDGRFIVSSEHAPSHLLLAQFQQFVAYLDEDIQRSPLIRALCETLDEMSGDHILLRRMKLYEAELPVLTSHAVLRSLLLLAEVIGNIGDEGQKRVRTAEFTLMYDIIYDATMVRLRYATDAYREMAASTDLPVDERLITEGMHSEPRSPFTRLFSAKPVENLLTFEKNLVDKAKKLFEASSENDTNESL